jgi:hypothetical protein
MPAQRPFNRVRNGIRRSGKHPAGQIGVGKLPDEGAAPTISDPENQVLVVLNQSGFEVTFVATWRSLRAGTYPGGSSAGSFGASAWKRRLNSNTPDRRSRHGERAARTLVCRSPNNSGCPAGLERIDWCSPWRVPCGTDVLCPFHTVLCQVPGRTSQ